MIGVGRTVRDNVLPDVSAATGGGYRVRLRAQASRGTEIHFSVPFFLYLEPVGRFATSAGNRRSVSIPVPAALTDRHGDRIMLKRLAWIPALVVFQSILVAQGGLTLAPISLSANVTDLIRLTVDTLNTYLRVNPQRDRTLKIRDLLAKIGGQEAQVAGQLAFALSEAERTGAKSPTMADINMQLDAARRTFDELTTELKSIRDLGSVRPRFAAGLYCVSSDSILYGYEGGCPSYAPPGRGATLGSPKQAFAAGQRRDVENAKVRRTIAEIQRESSYFLDIADEFDRAIGASGRQ